MNGMQNFVKLEDLDSDLFQREIKPESKMVFIIHGYSDSGNFLWRKASFSINLGMFQK